MGKINRKEIARRALFDSLKGKETLNTLEERALLDWIETSALTGKLEAFWSLSSSPISNPFCKIRLNDARMICNKCFSEASLHYKKELKEKLAFHSDVLSRWLISEEAWSTYNFPVLLYNPYGRIESHGDVMNVIHARNYIRLIKTHKHITFGVWSKNIGFWNTALKLEGGKPDNMTFIASSPLYNKPMFIPDSCKWFVDKVFTVYTLEYAMKNHIDINCGGRKCKHCLKCYKNKGSFYINELEKGDTNKAKKAGFNIGA